MSETKRFNDNEEIFSRKVKAGRRTYFVDVRSTKADDYYLTITESKKFTDEDGSFRFKKNKIYLYKEDFKEFISAVSEATDFVIENRGEEVISDRHQPNFTPQVETEEEKIVSTADFTNVEFEDL